jgi:alkanesulfonate monooxygenase SsuD/methylene tetrahydromethanopterin reductase-like flavin-dependent oxidoreductase (luciferase family)
MPWREGTSHQAVYQETLEQIDAAEALGFDAVWLAEHHFSPYGVCSAIFSLAAHVAARTSRVRVGTAVVVLPFYNPLLVAEEAATVDLLSGGRLDFGVGRGYQRHEFDGLGVPIEESRGRFVEALEIILGAWTQPSVCYTGAHYHVPEVSVYPRPIQRPHPPVWVAASVSPETLDFAAARGFPILTSSTAGPELIQRNFGLYAEALARHGRTRDGLDLPVNRCVYVAESARAAERDPEEPMLWVQHVLSQVGTPARNGSYPEAYRDWAGRDARRTFDDLRRNTAIFGTPDECVAAIQRLERDVGLTYLMCNMAFGGLEHGKVLRSMRLFAEEVMPRFR